MDVILHNRPEGTPTDNEFVAYGAPTTPSGQIKMSNFYTLLMSKLGFFKVSNLFSEIFGNTSSMASARANLSVPSVAEMQTADNLKANKSNVIEKNSTVTYTPTLATHPVNKKYVDDKIKSGVLNIGDPAAAVQQFNISFSSPFADNNYSISLTILSNDGLDLGIANDFKTIIVSSKSSSGFIFATEEERAANQNISVMWIAVKNNN